MQRVLPEELEKADWLFASFSDADRDAFDRMLSIADLLKNQSRTIVNLILADQEKLAREHAREAREALSPLEEELSNAMCELQERFGRLWGIQEIEFLGRLTLKFRFGEARNETGCWSVLEPGVSN